MPKYPKIKVFPVENCHKEANWFDFVETHEIKTQAHFHKFLFIVCAIHLFFLISRIFFLIHELYNIYIEAYKQLKNTFKKAVIIVHSHESVANEKG